MNASERRREIVRLLMDTGAVQVSELSQHLGVSEVTIRSDLATLDRQAALRRVRGGAVRRQDGSRSGTQERLGISSRHTQWLAMRAAQLIEDGDRIFVDSSPTSLALVAGLRDRTGLTVVTNGIDAARAAAENASSSTMLLGGILRPGGRALVGRASVDALGSASFDKAFVSCSAFDFQDGLLEDSVEEASIKRRAVGLASEVVALVDSTKLASTEGVEAFLRLNEIDQLLVDESAAAEHVDRLRAGRFPVSVCGDGHVAVFHGAPDAQHRWRVGFANLTEDHPFPFTVRLGLERAAAQAGNVDLFIVDNAMSGATALRNVDYFVRHDVDLVVEYQYHSNYCDAIMTRFREAEIPVVSVDVPMPGATYFGVDNYAAGLVGGGAAAEAAVERWGGAVDRVISLELSAAGRTPAARMQGQLDALRSRVSIADAQVIHLDSGNTRIESYNAVADVLPAFPDKARIVVLAGNDEVALGAIDALEQAGRAELTVAVSQGADAGARAALLNPMSPLVGAVSYVPEHYGPQLVDLALAILRNEPVPPAVFIKHELVTAESIRAGAHEWLAELTQPPPRSPKAGASVHAPGNGSRPSRAGRRDAEVL